LQPFHTIPPHFALYYDSIDYAAFFHQLEKVAVITKPTTLHF
jgi:hypothetical protein